MFNLTRNNIHADKVIIWPTPVEDQIWELTKVIITTNYVASTLLTASLIRVQHSRDTTHQGHVWEMPLGVSNKFIYF